MPMSGHANSPFSQLHVIVLVWPQPEMLIEHVSPLEHDAPDTFEGQSLWTPCTCPPHAATIPIPKTTVAVTQRMPRRTATPVPP